MVGWDEWRGRKRALLGFLALFCSQIRLFRPPRAISFVAVSTLPSCLCRLRGKSTTATLAPLPSPQILSPSLLLRPHYCFLDSNCDSFFRGMSDPYSPSPSNADPLHALLHSPSSAPPPHLKIGFAPSTVLGLTLQLHSKINRFSRISSAPLICPHPRPFLPCTLSFSTSPLPLRWRTMHRTVKLGDHRHGARTSAYACLVTRGSLSLFSSLSPRMLTSLTCRRVRSRCHSALLSFDDADVLHCLVHRSPAMSAVHPALAALPTPRRSPTTSANTDPTPPPSGSRRRRSELRAGTSRTGE